jgi:hypothetical protein
MERRGCRRSNREEEVAAWRSRSGTTKSGDTGRGRRWRTLRRDGWRRR